MGVKKAKEIWFLCRQYDAQQALEMGLINTVVPLERLEEETVQWCREMLALSPFSLRLLKASFNAAEDGLAGIQQLAHDANLLFYGSEEAKEGRDAYKQKRAARLRALSQAGMTTLGTIGSPPPRGADPESVERGSHLVDGGAPAHAARGCGSGAGGHLLGARRRPLPSARFLGRPARRDLHPGGHQPFKRLLGRATGRGHRGSAGAREGDRGRARATRQGACWRHT